MLSRYGTRTAGQHIKTLVCTYSRVGPEVLYDHEFGKANEKHVSNNKTYRNALSVAVVNCMHSYF